MLTFLFNQIPFLPYLPSLRHFWQIYPYSAIFTIMWQNKTLSNHINSNLTTFTFIRLLEPYLHLFRHIYPVFYTLPLLNDITVMWVYLPKFDHITLIWAYLSCTLIAYHLHSNYVGAFYIILFIS